MFSPIGHYLDYPLLEMGRCSSPARKAAYSALGLPLKAMLRATNFDKVVYVNHWLLNGGPPLELGHIDLAGLLEAVRENHPEHAVVFSGVVPALAPHLALFLGALGGRAVQSRVVHLLDKRENFGGRSRRGVREKRNVDRRLYDSRIHDRTTDREALLPEARRIAELYSELYVRKYSSMNPQYTEEFFRLILESEEFHVTGWRDDGRLEAFNIRLIKGGVNHWSICGYDTSASKTKGLFRLIAAEDVLGPGDFSMINWGGGNSAFKRFRGARPAIEYDVVFDDHLSLRRRIPWRVVRELRGLRNTRPAPGATLPLKSTESIGSSEGARARPAGPKRVALITSMPAIAEPFLSADLASVGLEIPIAVLIRPSGLLGHRMRNLPRELKRQAKINGTYRLLQLVNRVLYYRAVSSRDNESGKISSGVAALDTLASGRHFIESQSANDPAAVRAVRDAGCDIGLVIGVDVLTRRTIDATGVPLVNLHMSDPSFARGLPPVFWEVLDGRSDVTVTLHRLTVELDGGPVLAQKCVQIQWRETLAETLHATRRLIAEEAAAFLSHWLPAIVEGRVDEKLLARGPVRTIPRYRDVLRASAICRDRARVAKGNFSR
jgi:folate-dependent phosphoribosylglycinamide formyltransferase PurN